MLVIVNANQLPDPGRVSFKHCTVLYLTDASRTPDVGLDHRSFPGLCRCPAQDTCERRFLDDRKAERPSGRRRHVCLTKRPIVSFHPLCSLSTRGHSMCRRRSNHRRVLFVCRPTCCLPPPSLKLTKPKHLRGRGNRGR